jgi:hypothetical protein
LPAEPFFMSPLYPYFLAVLGGGRALGRDGFVDRLPLGVWIVQAALAVGVAWLLYRTARRILLAWGRSPRSVRWLAALPAAFYLLYRPTAIFATLTLLEVPLTLLAVLVLERLTAWTERGSVTAGGAAALGAAIGLATLLRPHAVLLLIPAVMTVGAIAGGTGPRRRALALLLAATGVVLLPVVLFNSISAGRPAGVSLNGGFNLYIGNGPEARGFYTVFADFDFAGDPAGVEFLERKLGRPVAGRAEADAIWAREALRAMGAHPLRAAGLYLKKVWLHFQAWEIDQLTPLAAWAEAAPPLRLLCVPYGLFGALGLSGIAWVGWRERRLRPWTLALGVLVAGQSVFFVVSRYRQVIVPILALGAGLLIARPVPWRRRIAAAVGVLLVAVALRPWGLEDVRVRWRALGETNLALRYELRAEHAPEHAAADRERAAALYTDARSLIPDRPEPVCAPLPAISRALWRWSTQGSRRHAGRRRCCATESSCCSGSGARRPRCAH